MNDPAPTRRSMLSYVTGGGVAVGALVAFGALGRSCAPVSTETYTRVDLSDMRDGDMRLYTFGPEPKIITRTAQDLTVLNATCPVDPPFGWVRPKFDGTGLRCQRCTSEFDRQGNITQFWSNKAPPADAPNLTQDRYATDGLVLLIAQDQLTPSADWKPL